MIFTSGKKYKVFFAIAAVCSGCLFAAVPQWWFARGVVPSGSDQDDTETIGNNYDAANVGQLKNIAQKAAEELNAKFALYGGAGTEINNMITAFSIFDAQNPNINYESLNIGQLKFVAEPFYRRLRALPTSLVTFPAHMTLQSGGTNASNHKYPWPALPANPTDADLAVNYEIANIGQLKFIFGWDVAGDSNSNGVSDIWEMFYFGSLSYPMIWDYDNDGLSNLVEFQNGTNPKLIDTDGDNHFDFLEVSLGTDPLDGASNSGYAILPFSQNFESYVSGNLSKPSYIFKNDDVNLEIKPADSGRDSKYLNIDFTNYRPSQAGLYFANTSQYAVWYDFYTKVEYMDPIYPDPSSMGAVNFYFTDYATLYYDGHVWEEGRFVNEGWHRITIKRSYEYDPYDRDQYKWSLWVDGKRTITKADTNSYFSDKYRAAIKFVSSGGSMILDNVYVAASAPSDYGAFDDDRDLLTNDEEVALGSNPQLVDTDSDAVSDYAEVQLGRNPIINDSQFSENDESVNGAIYSWSCDFSATKGYISGNLDGQNMWLAKNSVVSNTETAAIELSGENTEGYIRRDAFGENANRIWVIFDAIFFPGDLPVKPPLGGLAVAIAPDSNGDIFAYNFGTQTWVNITPENFDKQAWHRYYIDLNYITGVALVYVDMSYEEYSEGGLIPAATISFDASQGPRKFKSIHGAADRYAQGDDKYMYIDNLTVSTEYVGMDREFPALPAILPSYSTILDTDADGLDDNWEMQYFGDITTANASSDYNGDSVSDYQQYLDGTNPAINPAVNLIIYTPLEQL